MKRYAENDELNKLIGEACESTAANSYARNNALKQVKWRLKVQGIGAWVEVRGVQAMADITRHESMAQVFTGMDNEDLKKKFFEAVLKMSLEVEVVK